MAKKVERAGHVCATLVWRICTQAKGADPRSPVDKAANRLIRKLEKLRAEIDAYDRMSIDNEP